MPLIGRVFVTMIKKFSSYNPEFMDWMEAVGDSARDDARRNFMEAEIIRARGTKRVKDRVH